MSSSTNNEQSASAEMPKQNGELDQAQLDKVRGGAGTHSAGSGGGAGKTVGDGLLPAV